VETSRRVEAIVQLVAQGPCAGLGVGPEEVRRLADFLQRLEAANATTNLVSKNSLDPEWLVGRHLRDSLLGLRYLPAREDGRRFRLVDVGSGGGFPVIPLLLVREDLDAWLFESIGKKERFLSETIEGLSLTARVVNARFPFPPLMNEIRPVDVLTSRAVGRAGRLVREARPHLAAGAVALLWTTRPLMEAIRHESGMHRVSFHETPGTEVAGIAVLERST